MLDKPITSYYQVCLVLAALLAALRFTVASSIPDKLHLRTIHVDIICVAK